MPYQALDSLMDLRHDTRNRDLHLLVAERIFRLSDREVVGSDLSS